MFVVTEIVIFLLIGVYKVKAITKLIVTSKEKKDEKEIVDDKWIEALLRGRRENRPSDRRKAR